MLTIIPSPTGCKQFSLQCIPLLELVSNSVDFDIMPLSSKELTNVLLDGHPEFTCSNESNYHTATLKFIKSTERFKRN